MIQTPCYGIICQTERGGPMNCPNCGAVVKEGKFCNYCGAKLPDDTKRFEINFNQRIEDVAEVKRAENEFAIDSRMADLEEKESKLRQKKEIRKYRATTTRRWACIILFVVCAVITVISQVGHWTGTAPLLALLAMMVGAFMLVYIIALLVTGKW